MTQLSITKLGAADLRPTFGRATRREYGYEAHDGSSPDTRNYAMWHTHCVLAVAR
jgi:hypothetical protein